MKKILATLLCVVLSFSLFTVTSFAASYSTIAVSDNDVAEGDTFTVTLSVPDMTVSAYSTGITFDKNVLECTSLVGADPAYPDIIDLYAPAGRGSYVEPTARSTKDTANTDGVISATWAATADATYASRVVFTATFKVKDTAGDNGATTTNIVLFEERSGGSGYEKNDPADTKVISIAADAPVLDEAITVGATATEDATACTKTWNVEVGADLVGANKIKAVLTNSHPDVTADNTQEVALSFGTAEVDGELDCVFDVIVKFQDYAKYAATTSLAIVKAN